MTDRCTYGMIVNGVPSDEQRCAQPQAGRDPLPNYCLEHFSSELRGNPALGPEDIRTWAAAHADLVRLADEFPLSANQARVTAWILDTLGETSASNGPERSLRHVEEGIELAQACGVDCEAVHRLVDYVFARPAGEPAKEIAGCLVTLYGAASAFNVDAHSEFEKEIVRIRQPEVMERVRRRQAEKRSVTR